MSTKYREIWSLLNKEASPLSANIKRDRNSPNILFLELISFTYISIHTLTKDKPSHHAIPPRFMVQVEIKKYQDIFPKKIYQSSSSLQANFGLLGLFTILHASISDRACSYFSSISSLYRSIDFRTEAPPSSLLRIFCIVSSTDIP